MSERTRQVVVAKKRLPGSTSWVATLSLHDPDLMRAIFREAGAHIYDDRNDAVLATSRLLMVHTVDGGRRSLRLRNGKAIEVTLPPRSTQLFDAETGKATPFGPPDPVWTTFTPPPVSSDGKSVVLLDAAGMPGLWPIDGGDPLPIPGLRPDDQIASFAEGDAELFVAGPSVPVKIERLALATGRRTPWLEISPTDAAGLETWLHDHQYAIPDAMAPLLRPYVDGGSKFFVAKVDPARVTFDASGALPDATNRSRPPSFSRIAENTTRSPSAAAIDVSGPADFPRNTAFARARPAVNAQRNKVAFAPPALFAPSRIRVCSFS